MWLPWDYAVALTLGCLVGATAADRVGWQRVRAAFDEIALISALYALWQLAGRISIMRIDRAVERGQALWDWERSVSMPSEAWAQSLILPYPALVKASNLYYALVHVPAMGVFLAWGYFFHRDLYGRWRWVLALSTGACLGVQLVPVAPPRLVDSISIVDTPELYGQSVYAALGNRIAGQLQAMPSIHVGWAFLIFAACWQMGGSSARVVGVFHFLATFWVVAVTANHYWSDGLVAMVFVATSYLALVGVQRRRDGVSRPVYVSGPKDDAARRERDRVGVGTKKTATL